MRRFLILLAMLVMALPVLAEDVTSYYSRGDAVEDFTLTTWDGQAVCLSAVLAEKDAVVLHFFATWCGGCEAEMPLIQAAHEAWADRVGIIAVTIADGDTDAKLDTFCTRRGLTFPVARDMAGLAGQYPIYGVPLTVVIDKSGVLREIKEGAMADLTEFEALVRPYLIPEVIPEI